MIPSFFVAGRAFARENVGLEKHRILGLPEFIYESSIIRNMAALRSNLKYPYNSLFNVQYKFHLSVARLTQIIYHWTEFVSNKNYSDFKNSGSMLLFAPDISTGCFLSKTVLLQRLHAIRKLHNGIWGDCLSGASIFQSGFFSLR